MDMHTPSVGNAASVNGKNLFTAYKPVLADPVKVVDSDEELLESMGKAVVKDPRYERLNQWQKDLLQMKNEALISSDDIAEYCGLPRSVVNTTIYTSRASPRSDITAAIKALYNESLQADEQKIRALLTSHIGQVFEVWGRALNFEIPHPDNDKDKVRFFKQLASILMLNPLTVQRWVDTVQKPSYSKLRKYHNMVMTLAKAMGQNRSR